MWIGVCTALTLIPSLVLLASVVTTSLRARAKPARPLTRDAMRPAPVLDEIHLEPQDRSTVRNPSCLWIDMVTRPGRIGEEGIAGSREGRGGPSGG